MKKKLLSLLLSLCLVGIIVSAMPLIVSAQTYDGGTGTASDPYQISTSAQFASINGKSDYYVLTNDISLAGMGQIETFSGTLDGAGYVLSDFTATNAEVYSSAEQGTYNSGLICVLNGTVKNLGVTNFSVTSGLPDDSEPEPTYRKKAFGAIAGIVSGGNVYNCYVYNSTVRFCYGQTYFAAGGVVGIMFSGNVSNCFTKDCTISSSSSSSYTSLNGSSSGIIGYRAGGTTLNCFSDTRGVDGSVNAPYDIRSDLDFTDSTVLNELNSWSNIESYYVWVQDTNHPIHGFRLNLTAQTGGNVSGNGNYKRNTIATFSASANDNYSFTGWSDGVTSNSRTVTMSEDRSYTANFIENLKQITVTIDPTLGGTVSGGGTFANGTLVTLIATANQNYYFDGWYENDDRIVGTSVNAYSFNAVSDRNIVAKFLPVTATFSTNSDTGYYSAKFNGENKEGIIAFNALFNQYASYGEQLTDFGLYIYNTTVSGDAKATLKKPGNISDLRSANGYYFGTVTEIESVDFASKAVAVPFVVVAGKVYTGSPCIASVNDYIKWLGEKAAE